MTRLKGEGLRRDDVEQRRQEELALHLDQHERGASSFAANDVPAYEPTRSYSSNSGTGELDRGEHHTTGLKGIEGGAGEADGSVARRAGADGGGEEGDLGRGEGEAEAASHEHLEVGEGDLT